MEEKLDKLISLMESQNKAWEHSLQLLNGIHTLLVEKYKAADLLLEEHPPMRAPVTVQESTVKNNATTTVENSARPINFNDYSDAVPYGMEMEEERAPVAQSFPLAPNAVAPPDQSNEPSAIVGQEEVHTMPQQPPQEPQQPFREAPPEVPVTSKAEMMEQAEKRETAAEV